MPLLTETDYSSTGGKHDGIVKGERYFQTKPNCAVFTKYGQTNPIAGTAAPSAAKKTSVASSSSGSSAKSTATKPSTGTQSKPPSNPASSQVSSAVNSAAPTPPNELEDIDQPSTPIAFTPSITPGTSSPAPTEETSSLAAPSPVPIEPSSSPAPTTATAPVLETITEDPIPAVETQSVPDEPLVDIPEETPSITAQETQSTSDPLPLDPIEPLTPDTDATAPVEVISPVSTPEPRSATPEPVSAIPEPKTPSSPAPPAEEPLVVPTPTRKPPQVSEPAASTPSKKTTSTPSKIPTPVSKISAASSSLATPSPKKATTTGLSSAKKTSISTPSRSPVSAATASSSSPSTQEDDDGPSAYELEMKIKESGVKIKELEEKLKKVKADKEELVTANERLENQISILKEGSNAIMAQNQAGGAAREAAEAELKAQIRDLKSKLENSSDRTLELEKRNRELEQSLANASKSNADNITHAVQKATAELTSALNKLRTESEEKIETLSTDLEMATMDKEIAEEERDTIMREVEQLKMQNELLESSRQQAEQLETARRSSLGPASNDESGGSVDVLSSPEYVSLHTQHERLKEALVKLKDMAVEEKQQHERAQRDLEQYQTRTIPALEDKILKLQEANVDYEEQIEILKANIDDAAELQDKYSELFERKMDVEEDNKRLKSALKELEDIRELSDQLEEEQQATEARLKAELYAKQVEVLDRDTALKNAKEQLDSQSAMIDRVQGLLAEQRNISAGLEKKLQNALKSRGRRRHMPIDLEDGEMPPEDEFYDDEYLEEDGEDYLEESEETAGVGISHSSSSASIRSMQQQKESEIQVILQKQAAKAAGQEVVNKLRDLDRAQAIEQSSLYQLFVPEQFIRVDSEAIKSLLLAKRLVEKSNIVVHYLTEQYHLERFERSAVVQEDPAAITPLTTTDELAYFAWRLAAIVTRLGTDAAIFAESFKSADADTFLRFARLHSEIAPCEKKMDHLITLLQKEELTVSYSLTDFETLLDSFDPIIAEHCNLTALPAAQHYTRLGKELVFASRACFFEVTALKSMLNQLEHSLSQANLVASVDLISLTIVKYLVDGSRKLRRAAEGRPALTYVGATLSQLRAAVRVASLLHTVFASLRQRIIASGDRIDEAALVELRETVVAQYAEVLEATISELPPTDATSGRLTKHYDAGVTAALRLLFTLDEDIARGAHDSTAENPSSKNERIVAGVSVSNVAQLNARAAVLLEEVSAAAGLKGELASLQKEVRDRETTLGYKAKEIEDLEFRLKKQEHRLQTLEKVELEAKEELASHQKNYASQVMNLETANRELTEQVDQLQQESREARSTAQEQAARNAELEEQLAATLHKQQHSISLDSATTQISSLRATVRHLSSENAKLRSSKTLRLLETKLPPLNISPPFVSVTKPDTNQITDNGTKSAAGETGELPSIVDISSDAENQLKSEKDDPIAKLLDSAYSLSTSPMVVDLTRTDNTPSNQLESLQFETLRLKASILHASRQTVQALAESSNAFTQSHFASFPTTSFVANVNSTARGPVSLGRLTMPGSTALPVPKTLQVNSADLCSIHQLLVK